MDNRKSLDFSDVRIGMICEDYNGDKYEVVDKGSFAEMCRKTHNSLSDYDEELANEDAVAAASVDDPDEIVPWVYDGSGVLCFEGEANEGDAKRTKDIYRQEILFVLDSGSELPYEFSKETLTKIKQLASDPTTEVGQALENFLNAISKEIDG